MIQRPVFSCVITGEIWREAGGKGLTPGRGLALLQTSSHRAPKSPGNFNYSADSDSGELGGLEMLRFSPALGDADVAGSGATRRVARP